MTEPLLTATNLALRFGGVAALTDISFELEEGHILGMIGPNGAGKTSLINVISGAYAADSGSVRLDGREILGLPPHRRSALGLSRTFQNLAPFAGMSVYENVMVGRHLHIQGGVCKNLLRIVGPGNARAERISREVVNDLLERLGLGDVRDSPADSLPYGYQKLVELARALVSEPRLLLLDEPFAGMTPSESRDVAKLIVGVWEERSLTLVVIEHNMGLIMDIADEVMVLDSGRAIAHGQPDQIRSDPEVIRAYIGAQAEESEQTAGATP
jgi:branched-chain amino acid transport system ATP-binding protein